MKNFVDLLRSFIELHNLCVQISQVYFDPADGCTLPFHLIQYLLMLWTT